MQLILCDRSCRLTSSGRSRVGVRPTGTAPTGRWTSPQDVRYRLLPECDEPRTNRLCADLFQCSGCSWWSHVDCYPRYVDRDPVDLPLQMYCLKCRPLRASSLTESPFAATDALPQRPPSARQTTTRRSRTSRTRAHCRRKRGGGRTRPRLRSKRDARLPRLRNRRAGRAQPLCSPRRPCPTAQA